MQNFVDDAERNNVVDDVHLAVCFDTEPVDHQDVYPDYALKHIRLGELYRYTATGEAAA